jgi:hypothetical protein
MYIALDTRHTHTHRVSCSFFLDLGFIRKRQLRGFIYGIKSNCDALLLCQCQIMFTDAKKKFG